MQLDMQLSMYSVAVFCISVKRSSVTLEFCISYKRRNEML